MTRFIIVRHGDTFRRGEPARRIGRRVDLPLVDEGRAQARRLGRYFARNGVVPAEAYCGDLQRTRMTAQIILGCQRSAPALGSAHWLTEIDHGADEGRDEATVRARIGPAALEDWNRRGVPPGGWVVDPARRIDAWRRMFGSPHPGDVLLVTSSGVARFALLALGDEARPATLHLRTGAFGLISRTDDGRLALTGWDERP